MQLQDSWAATATSRDCFIQKSVNKDKMNPEIAETEPLFNPLMTEVVII